MELNNLFTDERAVSPVVGVALLIAIAVILAAVIGAVVLGLGSTGAETPTATLNADIDAAEDDFELSHDGGEPLLEGEIFLVVEDADTDRYELTEDLSAGQSVEEDAFQIVDGSNHLGETTDEEFSSDAEFAVVWEDSNSDAETVLEEFEA